MHEIFTDTIFFIFTMRRFLKIVKLVNYFLASDPDILRHYFFQFSESFHCYSSEIPVLVTIRTFDSLWIMVLFKNIFSNFSSQYFNFSNCFWWLSSGYFWFTWSYLWVLIFHFLLFNVFLNTHWILGVFYFLKFKIDYILCILHNIF